MKSDGFFDQRSMTLFADIFFVSLWNYIYWKQVRVLGLGWDASEVSGERGLTNE